MGRGSGIREVAWVDIAGGGQVVLDGNYAYVGHMQPPHGTSVLDVAGPANPRVIASIDIPPGLHSQELHMALMLETWLTRSRPQFVLGLVLAKSELVKMVHSRAPPSP